MILAIFPTTIKSLENTFKSMLNVYPESMYAFFNFLLGGNKMQTKSGCVVELNK